jgi:hypothetical protein
MLNLGRMYIALNRYDEAEPLLKKAINLQGQASAGEQRDWRRMNWGLSTTLACITLRPYLVVNRQSHPTQKKTAES